jgi:hypothetical protein
MRSIPDNLKIVNAQIVIRVRTSSSTCISTVETDPLEFHVRQINRSVPSTSLAFVGQLNLASNLWKGQSTQNSLPHSDIWWARNEDPLTVDHGIKELSGAYIWRDLDLEIQGGRISLRVFCVYRWRHNNPVVWTSGIGTSHLKRLITVGNVGTGKLHSRRNMFWNTDATDVSRTFGTGTSHVLIHLVDLGRHGNGAAAGSVL